MTNESIEQEIQSKGKTAVRVTPADIEANIASEHYFTAEHGVSGAMASLELHQRHADVDTASGQLSVPANLSLLTFCVLVLRNGTKVVGVNYGAIDPARHDPEMGRTEARKAAIEQVWPLMGYELRTRLSAQ
ncbi:MAG: hypothetical protein KA751_11290 [Comamonas sp.]|nr:hypothetical protein [Comamonas sp.]